MNLRRSRRYLLTTFGALALACDRPAAFAAAPSYTMRMSETDAVGAVGTETGLRFAAAVARRTNGQLKVEVYPNGQLAGQQESIDALGTGVIDFTVQATAFLTQIVPQFQVFDTPFLFKDFAAAYRVFDSRIGDELFALLEPKGIVGLGWGTVGFRELETSRAVVVPDDMKGLRIRIPSGTVYSATFQALGAQPVTIDINEVFTALTQKTIDAVDVPLASFIRAKDYTLLKHAALSHHILGVEVILASKRKLQALPPNLQKVLREEAKGVVPFMRDLAVKEAADAEIFLKQNGIAFTEIRYAAFRKAMDPVYVLIQAKLGGDLLDRVGRMANGTRA